MIVTKQLLQNKIDANLRPKFWRDATYLINIVNTNGTLGVVCYNYEHTPYMQPFCITTEKYKLKKYKIWKELLDSLPVYDKENISVARGKFYNTFDTPVEINNDVISVQFYVDENAHELIRKSYYLITDVQELERTFNSNIYPCQIVDLKNIDELFYGKPLDENLKQILKEIEV